MIKEMAFRGHYDGWRKSRFEGIKKYVKPSFFKDKSLLEVGCGYADNSKVIYDHFDCKNITVSDARSEHLNIVKQRHPYFNILKLDGDKDEIYNHYDIILHWGLLYHLSPDKVENHLKNICEQTDYLLLETEVMDSSVSDEMLGVYENGTDQSINNKGCRPSPSLVEKWLDNFSFSFKMINDPNLNSDFHVYDWEIKNTKTWRSGMRRYWVCWKQGVECPLV